jgi:hypothetical protein
MAYGRAGPEIVRIDGVNSAGVHPLMTFSSHLYDMWKASSARMVIPRLLSVWSDMRDPCISIRIVPVRKRMFLVGIVGHMHTLK